MFVRRLFGYDRAGCYLPLRDVADVFVLAAFRTG
jgi:hypothetical protein